VNQHAANVTPRRSWRRRGRRWRVAPVACNRGRAAMRGCFRRVDHQTATSHAFGTQMASNLGHPPPPCSLRRHTCLSCCAMQAWHPAFFCYLDGFCKWASSRSSICSNRMIGDVNAAPCFRANYLSSVMHSWTRSLMINWRSTSKSSRSLSWIAVTCDIWSYCGFARRLTIGDQSMKTC